VNVPAESPDRLLEARASELKAADDWAELCREFDVVGDEVLCRTPAAAYVYGEALYRTGRPRDLVRFAAVFEATSRASADPTSAMRALNMAGVGAFELGDMDTATRSLDALIELAHAEDDAEMLAPAANNLGAIADLQGRVEEALSYYRLALPLYEQADRPHGVAQIHHNLGLSYRELDRVDEAVRSHVKAVEVAEGVGYRPLVALSLSARAECELARGDPAIAAELADRSIRIARGCEDPVSEGDALRVRGVVRCEGGDLEGALADFEAAAEIAERTDNSLLQAESLRDQGRCLQRAGRPEEGRTLLLRAVTSFVELGSVAKADAIAHELGD